MQPSIMTTPTTALSMLFVLGVSQIGTAQTPPQNPPPEQQPPRIREEVQVVATRLPETPHDVPLAIEVLDGDELRARGVVDLAAALALATGVSIAPGGDNGPAGSVPEFW